MQATAAGAAATGTSTATLNISTEVAMLAAFAALVSALIALVALFIQTRRARRLLAIDLMFRLDDRFNSQAFQQTRAAAARALLGESKDLKVRSGQSLFRATFETMRAWRNRQTHRT